MRKRAEWRLCSWNKGCSLEEREWMMEDVRLKERYDQSPKLI